MIRNFASNMRESVDNKGNIILISYETPVAVKMATGEYYRTKTKYSQTTSKHIGKWLDYYNARKLAVVADEEDIYDMYYGSIIPN